MELRQGRRLGSTVPKLVSSPLTMGTGHFKLSQLEQDSKGMYTSSMCCAVKAQAEEIKEAETS